MSKKISTLNEKLQLKWASNPIFNSVWASKIENCLMKTGKKAGAENALLNALKKFKLVWGVQPIDVLTELIKLNSVSIETKPKRKAKTFFLVPTLVFGTRRYTLAIKTLVRSISSRNEQHLTNRIYNELVDNYIYQKGLFLKTTRENYKAIVNNRMYLRYRWQ